MSRVLDREERREFPRRHLTGPGTRMTFDEVR
jgi:hypothetical protein